MDPLTLLRDFVTLGKVEEISVSGERIDFGGRYSFGKSVSTSYKSQQGKEGFYDLESLVFFVRNTVSGGVKFGDYFKNARQAGLMPISALDRKVSVARPQEHKGKSLHIAFKSILLILLS